jgi:predicted alpha/beta-hydrolase family hydrolase
MGIPLQTAGHCRQGHELVELATGGGARRGRRMFAVPKFWAEYAWLLSRADFSARRARRFVAARRLDSRNSLGLSTVDHLPFSG